MKKFKTADFSLWQARVAVVLAVSLQLLISDDFSFGLKYIIALFGILLLFVHELTRLFRRDNLRQVISVILIGLISLTNFISLILVCHKLLFGNSPIDGRHLIISALVIYLTNIIIFSIWYWELATTGFAGLRSNELVDDFLFPQENMQNPQTKGHQKWEATYFDYLYMSVTNGTAFSPTDVMPLTRRAKLLMMIQSLGSLVTVALVAARAVNILN